MMTTIGDLRDSSKQEMIALYGTNFHYPDGEFRKTQETIELNSTLARYRSAPSAFFDVINGGGDKDYRFCRSSSPEMDTMMERFLSPGTCSNGSNPRGLHIFETEKSSEPVKQEDSNPEFAFPSGFRFHDLSYMNGGTSGSVTNSVPTRQNSSPAFFSNLGVNNGFNLVWESGSSKPSNSGGDSSPQQGRMNNHINFSLGSIYGPRIPAEESESTKRPNPSAFPNLSWDDMQSNSLKKSKADDHMSFSLLGSSDNLNENSSNRISTLTHHLSLPKTFSEMATMEKFYQLQGAVPCKIRAKRGFATHPRSIAERQRRTRISEKMRKLQNLFPNMDKQTSTADMLELAVEQIKELQKQVKSLKDTKSRCTC